MDHKHYTSVVGTILISGASLLAQEKRPNILYIFTDQQNAMAMSCSGNNDLKTPAMDRLAREGVRFTNAYCAFPLCTPSRSAMMTGVVPGASGNLINGTNIKEPYLSTTIGRLLENNGYDCAYGGKWHIPELDIPEEKYGFRRIHEHSDTGLAEACSRFLKEQRDKPFFLVASFDNPHNICEYARDQNLTYVPVEEPHIADCPNLPANFAIAPFDAQVIRDEQRSNTKVYPVLNYSLEDWRRYRNAYYRLTEAVDKEIGTILTALDKTGLWENTIVIFSSDHGDGNAAHHWNQKSALYEETTNVPFIVRMPQQKARGIIKDQLLNNGIDLYATICDFAGVATPKYCHGCSLKNILEEKDQSFNQYVVIETLFDGGEGTKGWVVRTKDYKYVMYDRGRYREQLFDMNNDRGEMVNLALERKYRDVLDQHRRLLVQWHKNNGVPVDPRATPRMADLK